MRLGNVGLYHRYDFEINPQIINIVHGSIYRHFYGPDNNDITTKPSTTYIYTRFILLTQICVVGIQ